MKKLTFLLFLAFSFTFANNQKYSDLKQGDPQIGDVLVLNSPKGNTYKHVDFPKLNFIVKRGGVANYKSVEGKHVVVKDVITKKDGSKHIILETKDQSKFFGFLKQVEANYYKSISSGELSKL